ncbi:chemotaxis protein CheA, partial [Burkholderia sp. Ax-1735]|nr:chemotaxis protein CheA [Burkholderia sp. Ax-1735]NIG07270.1 chemotaxis protein CheA [Burkholderia sp. Tr-849]
MNSNRIKVACAAMFAMTTIGAHAQTADSSSSSQSSSGSTAISQGGGSSMNTNTTSSRGGNATSSSGVRGSGNSSVNVNVTMPSGTAGGNVTPQSVNSLQSSGAPGTNPYNTQTSENVNYSGTQTIKTNPSIQAPGLTTTLSDTCMGSVSVGVSFPGFGATGGTTLVDQACVRRLDAREFRAMGLTDVALALLCQSDANRRAVEATGHLCPGTTAPLARSNVAPSVEATVADDVKYRDPIVRDRMGLPPLGAAAPAPAQPRPVATTSVQAAPVSVPVPVPVPSMAPSVAAPAVAAAPKVAAPAVAAAAPAVATPAVAAAAPAV